MLLASSLARFVFGWESAGSIDTSIPFALVLVPPRRKNPTELCLYLGDWWFWMPWSIVAIVVISKLVIVLLRLNDRLGLAKEISRTAFAGGICAGECKA